jgi:hypothetical protein
MNGKVGELRNSQLISTFGPGAIMDLPDFSVIIAGIDNWNTRLCETIKEPRLLKKLNISRIYSPPALEWDQDNKQGTLPAYRFPRFMVCPKCRKLAPFYKFNLHDDEVAYCHCDAETKVFPARFIIACSKGHIDDFPWDFYLHSHHKNLDCKGELRLNDKGATGSISDVEVYCTKCKKSRTLEDAFSGKGLPSCQGHRHWLGPRNSVSCDEKSRALLRGASNLYFPSVVSALAIPPYTSALHQSVAEVLEERLKKIDTKEKLAFAIDMGTLPELEEFDIDLVWDTITHQRGMEAGGDLDLFYPEWDALLHGENNSDVEFEFETEEQEVADRFKKWISKVVMVRRLTEVRVLDGFSRIEPLPDATTTEDDETVRDSYKAPLSNQRLSWRPGIITRGEGIFFTLDESTLQEWEQKISKKYGKDGDNIALPIHNAYRKYCEDRNETDVKMPGARYILLHTLSHALIRQLCLDSGYSSTSLRERIYSRNIEGQKMAGILIYTATPDSEGSLGGLVELGKKEKFEEILWHALQDARFCSGDPLCSEHKPDSIGDLNGAACHACQLAAETSCEKSNRFLDRSFLVPTVSEQDLAFFV